MKRPKTRPVKGRGLVRGSDSQGHVSLSVKMDQIAPDTAVDASRCSEDSFENVPTTPNVIKFKIPPQDAATIHSSPTTPNNSYIKSAFRHSQYATHSPRSDGPSRGPQKKLILRFSGDFGLRNAVHDCRRRAQFSPFKLARKDVFSFFRLLSTMEEISEHDDMLPESLMAKINAFDDFNDYDSLALKSAAALRAQLAKIIKILKFQCHDMDSFVLMKEGQEWDKWTLCSLSVCLISLNIIKRLSKAVNEISEEFITSVVDLFKACIQFDDFGHPLDAELVHSFSFMKKMDLVVPLFKHLIINIPLQDAFVRHLSVMFLSMFFQKSLLSLYADMNELIGLITRFYPAQRFAHLEAYFEHIFHRPELTLHASLKEQALMQAAPAFSSMCDRRMPLLIFTIIENICYMDPRCSFDEMRRQCKHSYEMAHDTCRVFVDTFFAKMQKYAAKDSSVLGAEIGFVFIRAALGIFEEFTHPGSILFFRLVFQKIHEIIADKRAGSIQMKALAIDLLGELCFAFFKLYENECTLPASVLNSSLAMLVLLNTMGQSGKSCLLAELVATFKEDMDIHELVFMHENARYVTYMKLRCFEPFMNLSLFKAFLLLNDPAPTDQVERSLRAKLTDESVLVRDVALECIGKCSAVVSDLVNRFKSDIFSRLQDSGVSVRKRALKLCVEVYQHVQGHNMEELQMIAHYVFSKFSDPETSVKEAALNVAYELFISRIQNTLALASITRPSQFDSALRRDFDVLVSLLSNTLYFIEPRTSSRILSELFSKREKEKSTPACACSLPGLIVDSLFDRLLDPDADHRHCYASFLQLICQWRPAELAGYFDILCKLVLDYDKLKKKSANILFIYLSLLSCVIKDMSLMDKDVTLALEKSMVSMLNKQTDQIIDLAIRLLSLLVEKGFSTIHVMGNLWLKLYMALKGARDDQGVLRTPAPLIIRSMLIMSLIMKQCKLDFFQSQLFKEKVKFDFVRPDSFSTLSVDLVMQFMSEDNPALLIEYSLHCLGNIIISEPSLILHKQIKNKLEAILGSSSAEDLLKIAALQTIFKAVDSIVAQSSSSTHTDSPPGPNREQTKMGSMLNKNRTDIHGLNAGICQSFVALVVKNSIHSNLDIMLRSIEIINLFLSHGLVHPAMIVPYYVAFESIKNTNIADLVAGSNALLRERHALFAYSKSKEALAISYSYHALLGTPSGGYTNDLGKQASLFDSYYSHLRVKKSRRYEFIHCVVHGLFDGLLFKNTSTPLPSSTGPSLDLNYIQFGVEMLAYLEYKSEDEPLCLLKACHKVLGHSVGLVLENLSHDPELERNKREALLVIWLSDLAHFIKETYSIKDSYYHSLVEHERLPERPVHRKEECVLRLDRTGLDDTERLFARLQLVHID